ncbi:MAG: SAM-dependent methyltransferase, partial [Betaproteobacteria bacterium]|nr:SAM-dependent methyltransferase [Betaproteobacteria bacterium]
LWGLRQAVGRAMGGPFLPRAGEFIGYKRIRDWTRLLGLEIVGGQFGCYRPPCRTERGLHRTRFMESAGDRWWPVLGALYFVIAVKRVRGMRFTSASWRKPALQPQLQPAVQATGGPRREHNP